jgi:hypothetical protein
MCMKQQHTPHSRVAGIVAALAAFGSLSALATAQPAPPPPPPPAAGAPAPPPNGSVPLPPGPAGAMAPRPPARLSGPPPLGGIVVAARPYYVQIRTRDGRYVNLDLRNGTVINPLGTTLTPGMRVAVRGVPGPNNAVTTDEIDVRVGPPPPIPNPGPAGPRGAAPPPPNPGGSPAGIPASFEGRASAKATSKLASSRR